MYIRFQIYCPGEPAKEELRKKIKLLAAKLDLTVYKALIYIIDKALKD